MPTTRRSTGGGRARAGPERGQSTISFASRVTKSVPKDAKKAALSDPPKQATVKATPPPKDEAEETPAEETPAEEASADEAEPVPDVTPDEEKSAAELRAEEVSDRDIAGYWAGVESGRIAPRAHQGDVTLSEKVLRYFDVSSQYGPSIGIDRTKRWMRADKLGLNPPIEVLAVLMREGERRNRDIETAYVEVLLSHTAAS